VEKRTIAIDLAKNVFEIAVADCRGKIIDRRRVSRPQLQRYRRSQTDVHVVMESCGTAHFWGRWCMERGLAVSLRASLLKTRNQVRYGWESVRQKLESQGEPDLANRTREFVGRFAPVQTDREQIMDIVIQRARAHKRFTQPPTR
jgi:hypothetical protein